MYKKRFKICIDVDDTIHYLTKAWAKWLNEKYTTTVDYSNIVDWDITQYWPNLTMDQICEALRTPEFWDTVEPMQDAIEYIQKLQEDGHKIYLCTSTDYRIAPFKFAKTIEKYFPFIDRHDIILTYNKKMIDCDFLIDDGFHNLGGNFYSILFDAPSNSKIDISQYNNIVRAPNWEFIYNFITSSL